MEVEYTQSVLVCPSQIRGAHPWPIRSVVEETAAAETSDKVAEEPPFESCFSLFKVRSLSVF